MRITVVGAGYVGLVSAACLAEFGHDVVSLDIDQDKIEELRAGSIPIYEPGLAGLITRHVADGKLRFETDYAEAIRKAQVVMVAVATPSTRNGAADLTAVTNACIATAKVMDEGTTVVIKSTVPVGTNEAMAAEIAATRPDLDFEMASNPEFLRQGSAVEDFMNPTRVVVGVRSQRAVDTFREVYDYNIAAGAPVVFTNVETAELIKYAANSFLAVKLSFINEIADVCEEVGADIQQLNRALGLDPRIGDNFLNPGPGYGGSCLPKDTRALMHATHRAGTPSRVVAAAIESNVRRLAAMPSRIVDACGGSVNRKNIAVLGLTFKAHTNDLRESPALEIIQSLLGLEANVSAYDPRGMADAQSILTSVRFSDDVYSCVDGADAVVIATEWPEFAELDLGRLKTLLREPVVVDLRNLYNPAEMSAAGLRYHSIGR